MRLAYFSPLPPSKSGIADYSAELLPQLARGAEITVFVERAEELKANQANPAFAVALASDFAQQHTVQPFDLCVYHQGNNPYHEYVYEQALQTPGLLVLHEHCLHHLIAWKTLGRKDEAAFWDEMFYAYGRKGARIAVARENASASEYHQFLLPLNRRILHNNLGVIVHNEFAAAQLDFGTTPKPVAVIPHHLSPRVYELDALDAEECRRALGLPTDAWIVASFGYVTQSKRLPTLLRAFKRLREVAPNAYCLIVGEDHWQWSIAPLIKELGLENAARITGYTSERDFFRYLKVVDVVVNLRFPTAGETSGTLIRSLGAGKPVIVSDYAQFGELPDDVCLKVAPGKDEERDLATRLRALASRPMLRERLAQRAAAWTRLNNDVARCAARYLQFADQLITQQRCAVATTAPRRAEVHSLQFKAQPRPTFDHAEALSYVKQFFASDPNATSYINVHHKRLLRTVELLPRAANAQAQLLELSSYLQLPLLARRFAGYERIAVTNWWQGEPRVKVQEVSNAITGEQLQFPMHNVNVERDRLPFADNTFAAALCCELIEHLQDDPLQMLTELHRVLQWGGLVILTTPNITSAFSLQESLAGRSPYIYGAYNLQSRADRHSREYTPADVQSALEAAGFKVVELFTENVWHEADAPFARWLKDVSGVPDHLRGDNIYAVGRKQTTLIERYPETLYD